MFTGISEYGSRDEEAVLASFYYTIARTQTACGPPSCGRFIQ